MQLNRTYKYLFLILIAMLVSSNATSQVTANFTTINSTEGCGSLIVDFKDLSLGNPTSWLWDLGNGNTSTLKDPTAIYNNPGVYDISLTVSDMLGGHTKIVTSFIQVYEKPIAELQLSSQFSGCAPFDVSFEDVSVTNSSIVSWQWDFGDGGSSNVQNPSYTYSSDGEYAVSLSVLDVNGCQSLVTYSNMIDVNKVPVADFSADITFSCDSLELVSFSNNSADASSFLWDFGDGVTSLAVNPSHIFSSGIYSVTLYADEGNCKDTLVMLDLIEVVGPLLPEFIVDTNSGCEGVSIDFFDITSNSPNVFLWDFGDGGASVMQNPTHVFDSAGIFGVTLTASISGQCVSSVYFPSMIEVFSKPVISFYADTTLGCFIPFDVEFFDNTIGAAAWNWDFGDGNYSNLQNPSNIYSNSGVFDVSLIVVNDFSCSSSVTLSSYIKADKSPIADFSASTVVSCVGEDINFSDLSSGMPNNWVWDFGDGSFSNIQHPIYQYSVTGIYDVSLVSGTNSCKDTLVIADFMKIIEPSAVFEEIYNCDSPLTVKFENLSIGADSVFWDFGDGNTSTLLSPVHTFSNLGSYTVSLFVNNNLTGCSHIISNNIELTKPIAQFDYLINSSNSYEDSVGCVPKTVYLENMSQDYAWFKVLWSDGYVGYGPTRHFVSPGVFDVSMIVTDLHGCKDTATIEDMYSMHDVILDFGISNFHGCDSLSVEFENLSNHPSSSVIWDFGDGGSSFINNPQYIYVNEGVYDVTLYSESVYGCKDTLNYSGFINFQHPESNFISDIQDVCIGDEIQFNNLSNNLLVDCIWDFGDGTISNSFNASHAYSSNGLYDISLLVLDTFGCSDYIVINNYIQVLSPTANFSAINLSSSCPPVISDFTNLSSSDVNLFKWNFGDGSTSFVEHPSHLFSNPGLFDVSLVVENTFGCKDSLTQYDYINMLGVMPSGQFMVSDTFICKDEAVLFIPFVANADSYTWDLGNGVVSNDSLASVSYSDTGLFIPSLIVENSSGCQLDIISNDTIRVNEVVVDAGLSVNICEGETVQLNAVGNGLFFDWSTSNGLSFFNVCNPLASPIISTQYYVSHTDGFCTAIDSVFVHVYNDIPSANFTVDNHCEGDLTSFVGYSGLSSTNNSYIWSFGEQGDSVNAVLSVGTNYVSLVVENIDNSCRDTSEQNVVIFPNPDSDFLFSDRGFCLGKLVDFFYSDSAGVISFSWDFGDGIGESSDQSPSYVYENPGLFSVSLDVTSDLGCSTKTFKDIVIYDIPVVDFLVENYCEGQGNIFTDLSLVDGGSISSRRYIFNDDIISTDSIAAHIFTGYGLFDIELTAISADGCVNSIVKKTEVFPNPIVDFVSSQFCEGDKTIFKNLSFVPDEEIFLSNWNFDSEGVSSDREGSHVFSSHGFFNVSLEVFSDQGCEVTVNKDIRIYKLPEPNFRVVSDVCLGDVVEFSFESAIDDVNVIDWNYNFGDGNLSEDQNPIHFYESVGIFDMSLEVVSVDGCINDTLILGAIEVHSLPIANFDVSNLFVSEISSSISFYNYSQGAESFMWDFDNGDYSYEENPSYRFEDVKTYNVSLKATSPSGCYSEVTKTVEVQPEYTFFIPDAFSPDGDGVNDVFKPKGNRIYSFEMQVFDRWGGLVFSSESIDLGWDGTDVRGDELNNGVYLYRVVIYDVNNKLWVYNGELSLVRQF